MDPKFSKNLNEETVAAEEWLNARARIAKWSIACSIVGATSYFHFFGFLRNLPPGIDTWATSFVSLCFSVLGLTFFLHWGIRELRNIKYTREDLAEGRDISGQEFNFSKLTDEFSWRAAMLPIFLLSAVNLFRRQIDPQLALGYYFLFIPFWGGALWMAQNFPGNARGISRLFLTLFSALVILKFYFGK